MKKNKQTPAQAPARPCHGWHIAVTACLAILILVNMVIIFQFSSAGREESGELSAGITRRVVEILYRDFGDLPAEEQQIILHKAHKFVRKAAHFSEFALLGFLSTCLLLYVSFVFRKLRLWLTLTVPAVFALLYAISDEVHQIFTNRGPRVTDVLIDFAGATCGILLIHGIAALLTRKKKGKKDAKKQKKHRRRKRPCETPDTN